MAPFESLRNSSLAIRWSVAIVFIWFGVDKFIHPNYWMNAWYSKIFQQSEMLTVVAITEVLIGISMLTGLFIKWFSLLGIIMVLLSFLFFGINEVIIRNIALLGAFTAILFWPSRRSF